MFRKGFVTKTETEQKRQHHKATASARDWRRARNAVGRMAVVASITTATIMNSGGRPPSAVVQPQEMQTLTEGNTAFALDLYAKLAAGPGNLFFSPLSVSGCLAIVYAGARGQTESQIAKVLHFSISQTQLHSAFGALQRQLREVEAQPGIQLNIANALWAEQGHPFLPDFLETARAEYQANINQADFRSSANAAIQEINQWVSQQTKDKIQNILPEGSLNAQTRLVLANAIYFKGLWAKQFDKTQTSTQAFHFSKEGQVDVPLMHRVDEVRYCDHTNFQAVELPYSSNQLSLVMLLPRQANGCHELEERLTPPLLSESIAQMKIQKVEMFLPRFKVESSLELARPLAQMGMADAFGPQADFSGIDGTHSLSISAVFHKAWGEVNEEGTEAAAATVGTIRATAVMRPITPPPVFRADHPFIFLIRDRESGALLFLGRLENPKG